MIIQKSSPSIHELFKYLLRTNLLRTNIDVFPIPMEFSEENNTQSITQK